jgi:hypothetical protein
MYVTIPIHVSQTGVAVELPAAEANVALCYSPLVILA